MEKGKRFSQIYLEKGQPVKESSRMRKRISAIYREHFSSYRKQFVNKIEQEIGCTVPIRLQYHDLNYFFNNSELRDLLDSITIIFQVLYVHSKWSSEEWYKYVSRIFQEENVGYRVDEKCGVHYFVDEEFERNKNSVIAGLSSQKAVQEIFEQAYNFLDQDEPDTASSIRSIFEAMEVLYKHIIDAEGKDRLSSNGIKQKLKPIIKNSLSNNLTAETSADHLLDGFCDWVDAGHMYRHGQKIEEVEKPPIDLCILYLSQGASYLRFLIQYA